MVGTTLIVEDVVRTVAGQAGTTLAGLDPASGQRTVVVDVRSRGDTQQVPHRGLRTWEGIDRHNGAARRPPPPKEDLARRNSPAHLRVGVARGGVLHVMAGPSGEEAVRVGRVSRRRQVGVGHRPATTFAKPTPT